LATPNSHWGEELWATTAKCLPEPNWPTSWLRKATNWSGLAPIVEVFAHSSREESYGMSASLKVEDIQP
jgi:hypothetical protein